jgi:hypothetical protein
VKLAAVLVWQLLHWSVPVGMCGGVVMPVAVVPLWQLAQLVSLAEWANVAPAKLVVLLWQVEQSWPLTATWPGNDAVPCAPAVPWLV